ncbi:putative abc transporter, partial [Operophtera brumata]
MALAADLKLPTRLDQYEKGEVIEDILTNLGLYEHMNTRSSMLSGGQKKRLSIALELINNPLIMFLDEPTTGLDSSSCSQVVQLCRSLAHQGRTIVCTVHQPSASLFALFDQVYVLAAGQCLYQGTTRSLVPYLEQAVIELACGEYGEDKIQMLSTKAENGRSLDYFDDGDSIPSMEQLRKQYPLSNLREREPLSSGAEETSQSNQRSVLIKRGFMKAKRDSTMTHLRLIVNVLVGFMLGSLFINAGNEGSRVLENYNLLFAILMHHMMSPMMLTILTCNQHRLVFNVLVGFMLGSLFINAGNEGSRVLENYNLLFAILMHHMMSPMMLTILTCYQHRLVFNVLVGFMLGSLFIIEGSRVLENYNLLLVFNVLVGFMLGSLFIIEGSRVLENYNLLFAILMHHMMPPMILTILTCNQHRLVFNVLVGFMLGSLFINEGSRVLENYNLLFAILMHHMMSPMMLTILTYNPVGDVHLVKGAFQQMVLIGIIVSCALFTVIVYTMSSQPLEIVRFLMFFAISFYTVLVAQSFGLMIGAAFNVVNGTFLGPTLSVPMMMFAGFGVTLRDLPPYLYWGSYVSYLRYGLEGFIGAIYGLDRPILDCNQAEYCHY